MIRRFFSRVRFAVRRFRARNSFVRIADVEFDRPPSHYRVLVCRNGVEPKLATVGELWGRMSRENRMALALLARRPGVTPNPLYFGDFAL